MMVETLLIVNRPSAHPLNCDGPDPNYPAFPFALQNERIMARRKIDLCDSQILAE
jgi:hypothetical protein